MTKLNAPCPAYFGYKDDRRVLIDDETIVMGCKLDFQCEVYWSWKSFLKNIRSIIFAGVETVLNIMIFLTEE